MDELKQKKRARITAAILGLVALGFYLSAFLIIADK